MTFQWSDFLDIAKSLHAYGKTSQLSTETAYRCAISRAYYAAFCHSRDFAAANTGFVVTKKAIDHGNLRRHLFKHGQGTISTKLDQLRGWRNNCDYDNPSPIPTEGTVILAISEAEIMIKTF